VLALNQTGYNVIRLLEFPIFF